VPTINPIKRSIKKLFENGERQIESEYTSPHKNGMPGIKKRCRHGVKIE